MVKNLKILNHGGINRTKEHGGLLHWFFSSVSLDSTQIKGESGINIFLFRSQYILTFKEAPTKA